MSEITPNQTPSPENHKPQPIYDTCITEGCGKKYELTNENTAGRIYPGQPECNYLYCICPHCSGRTRIFAVDATLEQAAINGIEIFDDEKYAEPEIYDAWCRAAGIELIATHELTHRLEHVMGKAAFVLNNTPDEYLYDLITDTGYDQPYPQKWID